MYVCVLCMCVCRCVSGVHASEDTHIRGVCKIALHILKEVHAGCTGVYTHPPFRLYRRVLAPTFDHSHLQYSCSVLLVPSIHSH